MDPTSIPVVGKIVEKISDIIVAALFSHLNYIFCSKSLVEDLKSEKKKLEIAQNLISGQAEKERSDGRILEKHVEDWKEEARQNQEGVKTCLEKYDSLPSGRCFGFLPIPHPLSRYRLGKEAESIAKATNILATSGNGYLANPIAHLLLDMNAPATEFHEFKSREEAYQKLEGLVNDSSYSILGIYGIAGAGKTRLMERLTTEAVKKGTFHKVVRANLGNSSDDKLDVIGIQQQLAGKLGCKFESETDVERRASQLKSSLKLGGSVLVILDDIWCVIPLDTIGILSGDGMSSIGGKILFTSRSEENCKLNKCEHPVKIEPLTTAEAWDMFSKTVGADTINSLQNISIAKDICKRCGGLPLVILAVGNALKFKPFDSWKDARNQLKNSKIEDMGVYACLKLSFDHLEDDAKACLLLSSMYPEDADIPIRELVHLARGSELLGSHLIKGDEIKTRVQSMLYILNSASLLLQGKDSEHIKLHDIIRDMARSIAIKDYGFLFATSRSLTNNPAQYSGVKVLHIDVEEDTRLRFPSNAACPDLHTLWLHASSSTYIDPTTLQGWMGQNQIFANLGFLVLVEFSWPKKFSLESLDKLKTLWFVRCFLIDFGEREIGFLPENLENLCFWDCVLPEQLNLPALIYLRKLEIYINTRPWLWREKIIVEQNTISRLSGLEELSLPPEFYIDEKLSLPYECAKGGSSSVLDEVSKLPCLTSLHICSGESNTSKLVKKIPNLREFQLFFGEGVGEWSRRGSSVSKAIELSNRDLTEDYQIVIEMAEEVILCNTNFTRSNIDGRDTEKFINLRYMKIKDCDVIENLARMSPGDKIRENHHRSTPFSNLMTLQIINCPRLKYLFCDSVARCLVQLQKLYIKDCPVMEQIVLGTSTSRGNIINMSKLQKMRLFELPRLIHFYKDNISSCQIQPLFNQTVVFPSLEELYIRGLEDITDIWGDNNDNASSFFQLKKLKVHDCDKLKNVIPPAMLRSSLTSQADTLGSNADSITGRASQGHVKPMVSHSPNKKLKIFLKKIVRVSRSVCRRTPMITEENMNEPSDISVQVPSRNTRACPLVEMNLAELPCLEKTGLNCEDQSGAVRLYPNLVRLEIYECNRLENLFIPFADTNFPNLEDMSVIKCSKMHEIVGAGKQKITNGIMFLKLCSLELSDLPGLTSFWGCPSGEAHNHKVEFPNLKKLQLHCGENTSFLEMIESGIDVFTFQLENLAISCGKEIQIPKQWLLQLDNLESLLLHRCWSDELKSLHFQRLKKLTLRKVSCSTIFSFPDFERLQQLQELEITNCDSLEHIVEVVKGEEASGMDTETAALLVQLESIYLEGLPKLKSFMHTKPKNLEQVEVEPSILFTCSVFRNLQQLRALRVIDCGLLEGIVEVARGYETSDTDDRIITFPKLLDIFLTDLANLQNFSPTTSYSFNMPNLDFFRLIRCPRVENKPFLQIIAEKLVVFSDEDPEGIVVEKLKDYTIRRINKLESVGESSNSILDVETETMRVEEEEERVVEQAEEGIGVEEDDFFFLRKSQTSLFVILFLFLILVLCLKEV